jgi:hypothetical protein
MKPLAWMRAISIVGLVFAVAAASRAQSERPALFYALNTQSETVDSWGLGILPGLIGETYRNSHERFLAALESAALGDTDGLLQPFACLDASEAGRECHRLVEASDGLADENLIALLSGEAARSARVVELTVIFDGRFFQVPTRMYEAQLDSTGEIIRSHELRATYIRTYSRTQHEEDIETHRNKSPFAGKVGSKEARVHFWLGGSNPRLVEELELSVGLLGQLWAATRSPDATGILANDYTRENSLPLVKDIASTEPGPCETLHDDFLVVREVGEHLWLVGPSRRGETNRIFFIEPRCEFDY